MAILENDNRQRFEDQSIRTAWDEENEEWYFSVVDVVSALTEQKTQRNASTYWAVLKKRLKEEGADQLLTNCKQLKMKSPKDGKRYKTDVATTEQLLRIIQSIPAKKAEPCKMWLAQVGRARKELTDAWKDHGVQEGKEYAILTDEVTKAWSGMNTRQYKNLKGLKKENLRDNMSTLELALNMLAEATTTELVKVQNPQGLAENKTVAKQGGQIAGTARKNIEAQTGRPVITSGNANSLMLNTAVIGMIEGVVVRDDSDSDNEIRRLEESEEML